MRDRPLQFSFIYHLVRCSIPFFFVGMASGLGLDSQNNAYTNQLWAIAESGDTNLCLLPLQANADAASSKHDGGFVLVSNKTPRPEFGFSDLSSSARSPPPIPLSQLVREDPDPKSPFPQLDGEWRLDGTNLVCTLRNKSSSSCLMPFDSDGQWICHAWVTYSLNPEDFPKNDPFPSDLPSSALRFFFGTPILITGPFDPGVTFKRLLPNGESEAASSCAFIERHFPLNPEALFAAHRAFESPKDPVFDVELTFWFLEWVPSSKTETRPTLWFRRRRIRLHPASAANFDKPTIETGKANNR